ncbi:hypothetical protein MMC28_006478 [Mycoblastus sanguinarius]|nr:hypothetical protein [Mycoblastus sanguinarius]
MAYPAEDAYNRHRAAPQFSGDPSYGAQYPQHQVSKPSANGFIPQNENAYRANGQIDPKYVPIHGAQQHRPVPSYQTHQTPQRVQAVVVLPLPASTNTSNGYTNKSILPQHSNPSPPLDYQVLLLSLAEEYFAAAYGYGSMADILLREAEKQSYYKLIATGLGCLEALLKHFRLAPEREAVVSLRYATVLYEETENTEEAEEALSKGATLCDRHRLFDLKYNMQHLLARILFQKHSRAAFKFLESILKDSEAYQHIAWVYAFRFLKISLHLELSSHQDITAALVQLRSIIHISNGYGDKAVLATATTLEALTCLRQSSDAESVEQAQRALAVVRSLQLDPAIGKISQLEVLTSLVDLCCHLQHFDPAQAMPKFQILQTAMKAVEEGNSWTDSGCFAIPMSNARMPSCTGRSGIIRKEDNGFLSLMFNWMPKEDIYRIGYFLSGVALAHRNTTDGQKSENMLNEGIRRQDWAQKETSKLSKSILLAASHQIWRERLTCYMRLHLAFTLCARTSWTAAKDQLLQIRETIIPNMDGTPEPLILLNAYLEGTISQGTSELSKALAFFQSSSLSLSPSYQTPPRSQLAVDISILSALNTVLIVRSPVHPQHHILPSLLATLGPLCLSNPNRQIQSAYHLVSATTPSSSTILLTKQSLQSALQTAKQTSNNQLMCMVLNFMSWKFFRGVVGEQAEKSARASQSLAVKCMDGLWMSISAGVLGDTLEAAGRVEEAEKARQSGFRTAGSLPDGVQLAMRGWSAQHDVPMAEGGEEYEAAMRQN